MKLKVALIKNEDLSYTVYVPSLRGCISEGKNKKEALKNIQEAIELYLEDVDDDKIYESSILAEVSI